MLSNEIASQAEIFARYGGVVPEIASRAHCEIISSLTHRALEHAGVSLSDIGCIGVTSHPGLIGALLVGVNFAKGLAYANNIPLVSVNHIKGHIAANYINEKISPPFCAFVASGGHTSIILADSYTQMRTVGRTLDDAIGEAFDKVGRVIGLPYPSGAKMDALASEGDPFAFKLPSAAKNDGSLNLSLSGLKTYTLNLLNTAKMSGEELCREDLCASLTRVICESVISRLESCRIAYGWDTLLCAGGVLANSHLRGALAAYCKEKGVRLCLPSVSLCGDNAVMIAAAAKFEFEAGHISDLSLDGTPSSKSD